MCKGLAILPATCLKSVKDIKHKIGFLLQKPDVQAADQKQQREKTTAAKRAPLVEEVEKWKESFNNLMTNEDGRKVFTDFLRSEFSQENMEFWNACQQYKKTPPAKMAAKAKQIYQQYVEAESPNEVNLDSATREETKQSLEHGGGPSCFDEAQKKIYTLMEKDSYRRFLHSKLILDLSLTHAATTAAPLDKKGKKNNCSENKRTLNRGA